MSGTLSDGWRHGTAWLAVTGFVTRVATPGSRDFVAPAERVAVFDDDGTLWTERPVSMRHDFILRRLVERAKRDQALRGRLPWRASSQVDLAKASAYLAEAVASFDEQDAESYAEQVAWFLAAEAHPELRMPYAHAAYLPMAAMMAYLEAHDFTVYILTAGDRDFARPAAARLYGVPPERVIGDAVGLRYRDDGAIIAHEEYAGGAEAAARPAVFWSRVGRRPILAVGNSNADIPLLRFTGGQGPDGRSRPALRMLVVHDDAEREYAYTDGAEDALAHANTEGWTQISMREDWSAVFGRPQ